MRIFTLAVATAIAATTLSPAFAATKHKHQAAPVQNEYSDPTLQTAPVAARPGVPAIVYDQPNACFTDEGYGRYASCDQAGY
jgi:hypothetical protein